MINDLSPALEDYLLAIFRLEKLNAKVRSKDIMRKLSVAKSTVTSALQSLCEKKLINYAPYEPVSLTESGLVEARQLALRNRILREFLENILIFSSDEAETVANSMEHSLEPYVLERFICFMAYNESLGFGSRQFQTGFRNFLVPEKSNGYCSTCIDRYLHKLDQTSEKA